MSLTEGELPDWVHRRAREGCKLAISVVVNRHIKFAAFMAKRASRRFVTLGFDDLNSFAQEGLLNAAKRHDPARGTKFITTADSWVNQAIKRGAAYQTRWFSEPIQFLEGESNYLKVRGGERRIPGKVETLNAHVALNRMGPRSGIPARMLHRMDESAKRDIEIMEARFEFESLPWGALTDREREAVLGHHIDGLQYKQIADRRGVSRSTITQDGIRGEFKLKKAVDRKMRARA